MYSERKPCDMGPPVGAIAFGLRIPTIPPPAFSIPSNTMVPCKRPSNVIMMLSAKLFGVLPTKTILQTPESSGG